MDIRKLMLCMVIVFGFFVFDLHWEGHVVGTSISADAASQAAPNLNSIAYEEVQAIFDQRCVQCHSGEAAAEGLRLTSYDEVMEGSGEEKIVLPGRPEESELVKRIDGTSEPRMPLNREPLSEDEIALIARWIETGAQQ